MENKMKSAMERYEERLGQVKQNIVNSNVLQELEFKKINSTNLDRVISEMNTLIAPKRVYEDFNFRTGKLFGVMRAFIQNYKLKNELLEITGLTQDYIDFFRQFCGNLPYIVQGSINPGEEMDVENTKDFIRLLGAHFEYVVSDSDLFDINKERWDRLVLQAMEKHRETLKHTAENSGEVEYTE
jgi:hypothetical protein